ncbi:MAG: glycosyltransferase family 4 protein [Pseudomonadota bacterium]
MTGSVPSALKAALITPMKSPDAPTPSGDRTFGRLIRAALTASGHQVTLPPQFTTWCRRGADFEGVARAAPDAISAAVRALEADPPDVILTYHNYHKAPDLLGPALARQFGAAYAIIEASRSPKRAQGEWARGFEAADRALQAAAAWGAVTPRDLPELMAFCPHKVIETPPFIDAGAFSAPHKGSAGGTRVVSAAMMREGRKADSVRLLCKAFDLVRQEVPGATLEIAGGGPALSQLKAAHPHASFLGQLGRAELASLFASSDVFAWPALHEPFGFVFLEAQSAGLPVVGGDTPGVHAVVRDGETGFLAAHGDAKALAARIVQLMTDSALRQTMGMAARRFARANDLEKGAARLSALMAKAFLQVPAG